MEDVSNDWERRYKTALECAACGRTDVHARDCPVLRDKARKTHRIGLPVVLVTVAFVIWQGAVGEPVAAVVGGAIGSLLAALVVERARRSP